MHSSEGSFTNPNTHRTEGMFVAPPLGVALTARTRLETLLHTLRISNPNSKSEIDEKLSGFRYLSDSKG